jgi:hypothetical protein
MIIDRPNPIGGYGTHLYPLIVSFNKTSGDVIEFGLGDFSTLVLNEMGKFQNRKIYSYDNDKEWYKNFVDLNCETHKIKLIDDWDQVPIMECGLVLIDHAPKERRVIDIERFQNHAKVIVVHDTDAMDYYGYQPYFDKFKYKIEYKNELGNDRQIVLSSLNDFFSWR